MARAVSAESGSFGLSAVVLTVATGLGLAIVYVPGLLIFGGLTLLVVYASIKSLTLPRRSWRFLWLGTTGIAAFGPFLDIVTHQPVNWLVGLAVLVFWALMLARPALRWSDAREAIRDAPPRLPVLGTLLSLYVVYLLLQALRPDVETWKAMLVLRAPLIGLAAYFLTTYSFQPGMSRNDVIGLVAQFLRVVVVVGAIVAAYSLLQFAVGFDRLQAWGLTESGGSYLQNQRNLDGGTTVFRVFGTMRRNEALGAFLYLNIVACAVVLRLGLRPRWLVRASLALSLTALLLALSLTSLVTLLIWSGLLVVTVRSKRLASYGIALSGLIFVGAVAVNRSLGGLITLRVAEHVVDTREGIGRVQMFTNWLSEMSDRPTLQAMFGSGICTGADEDVLGRLGDVLQTIGIRTAASSRCGWQREIHDNWYATHSLEIGWLGLLLVWGIFVLIIIYALPRVRRRWEEPERGAWTMLALGVLALWPSGFVGALIMYMPIALFFWSMVALLDVAAGTQPQRLARAAPVAWHLA